MNASEILKTAADIVAGDRQRTYGDKHRNHANIAKLWDAYLDIRRRPGNPLTPCDVALMMGLAKVARTDRKSVV